MLLGILNDVHEIKRLATSVECSIRVVSVLSRRVKWRLVGNSSRAGIDRYYGMRLSIHTPVAVCAHVGLVRNVADVVVTHVDATGIGRCRRYRGR